jgi:hypothetical protein
VALGGHVVGQGDAFHFFVVDDQDSHACVAAASWR